MGECGEGGRGKISTDSLPVAAVSARSCSMDMYWRCEEIAMHQQVVAGFEVASWRQVKIRHVGMASNNITSTT